MKLKTLVPKGSDAAEKLFDRVRELVIAARQTVARGVDLVQVHTCYRIGMYMVEHEQQGRARADYGKALLDNLATRLTAEFGRGFSRSSLASMRSFYLAYPGRMPIVQAASGQSAPPWIVQTASGPLPQAFRLSWSHYVFLLGIKNPDERSFYEIEAAEQSWTVRELIRGRVCPN